jgi:ComF family protein
VNNWLKIAHDWLLPRHCLLCLGAATGLDLCAGCRSALPRIENPCRGCGIPLVSGRRCSRCLKSPPPFDQVCIPYLYAEPVTSLIHTMKFRHRLAAASVLGDLLADHLERSCLGSPECIVPVPLHPQRQRERGFNQSMEIARPVSARLKLPLRPGLARRTRPTVAQSRLQGIQFRRRNVRGAFSADFRVNGPVGQVAIVDDVVTTCATVIELALTLRRAGATRIDLWSVARAGEP